MPHKPEPERTTATVPTRTNGGTASDITVHGDHTVRREEVEAEARAGRAALLAPFVAWMATQTIDEVTRRRHRQNVDAYLEWCATDDGPTTGRRRRYENERGRHNSHVQRTQTRAGLDQYALYRDLVARTLPYDH